MLNVRMHILTEGATYDIGTRKAAAPVPLGELVTS
jgi:hypothetical protein